MRSGRALHLLALLTPPLVVGLVLLLAAETYLRWQRFGAAALTQPLSYMAPAWRDSDCFPKGPKGELMTPDCSMPYKGVTVQTNGATVFKDSNEVAFATEDDFWAAVSDGSLINIDGTETGPQTLLADEVELELE